MMKIALIAIYSKRMNMEYEETGISYIGSYLRSKGHSVFIAQYSASSISYKEIVCFNPDIIGFPVYSLSLKDVTAAVDVIREMIPSCIICLGGNLATYNCRELLEEYKNVDFVIRGEGEITFEQLIEACNQNRTFESINGLAFRKAGIVHVNKGQNFISNFEKQPNMARDILINNRLKKALIMSSRGCIGNCSFCSFRLLEGGLRSRSVNSVVDEIVELNKVHGIKHFDFADASICDTVRGDSSKLMELAKLILQTDLHIYYYGFMRADIQKYLYDEDIKTLALSGLTRIVIGTETANLEDRKLYRKSASLNDNIYFFDKLFRNNLHGDPGFINFNPYTTPERLRENIKFLDKFNFASNINRLLNKVIIYKGTPLYEAIIKDRSIGKVVREELIYTFKEMRIQKLYTHMHKSVNEINQRYNIFPILTFFSSEFDMFANIALRNCGEEACIKRVKYLNQCLCAEANTIIVGWFTDLLCLVEQGWNEKKADEITHTYFDDEKLLCIIHRLRLIYLEFRDNIGILEDFDTIEMINNSFYEQIISADRERVHI